jgi:hypothetical protein
MKISKTTLSYGILIWASDEWENMWNGGKMFKREGVSVDVKGKSVVKFSVWIYLNEDKNSSWSIWTDPDNDPILEGNVKTNDFDTVVKHLNKSISKFSPENLV